MLINTLDGESGLSEVVLSAKLIKLYIDKKIDSRNFSCRYRKGHKGQVFVILYCCTFLLRQEMFVCSLR